MIEAFRDKIKDTLGEDAFVGLIGMFLILHFYYAVPEYGWAKAMFGLAAVFVSVFVLSFISYFAGRGWLATFAFTSSALAIDFFYNRGGAGNAFKSVVFEYLANGPAVVNFATFGFASAWFFSQMDFGSTRPSREK